MKENNRIRITQDPGKQQLVTALPGTDRKNMTETLMEMIVGPIIAKGFRILDTQELLQGVVTPQITIFMEDRKHEGNLFQETVRFPLPLNVIGLSEKRNTNVANVTGSLWKQTLCSASALWYPVYEGDDIPHIGFGLDVTGTGENILSAARDFYSTLYELCPHEFTKGSRTFSWISARKYGHFLEPQKRSWTLSDVTPMNLTDPDRRKAFEAVCEAGKRI